MSASVAYTPPTQNGSEPSEVALAQFLELAFSAAPSSPQPRLQARFQVPGQVPEAGCARIGVIWKSALILDPPAAPEGPCRPPKSIIFHCFPYVSPSLNLVYFSTLQGRVSTVVLLAPNTINNLLTKQNLTNPLLPWWSLGVTQGWVRGVSEAGCACVGVN